MQGARRNALQSFVVSLFNGTMSQTWVANVCLHSFVPLQDVLAAAGRDPDPKVVEDITFLAGRMDDMLRMCLGSSEAAGEGWCRKRAAVCKQWSV